MWPSRPHYLALGTLSRPYHLSSNHTPHYTCSATPTECLKYWKYSICGLLCHFCVREVTFAGYLPVPLFNQKKRNRQPLTSNPLKNELCTSNPAENVDYSAMLADFGWEIAKPEPTRLQKTIPAELPVPPLVLRHQNAPTSAVSQAEKNFNNWRLEEKNNTWKRNNFPALGSGTDNRKGSQLDNSPEYLIGTGSKQQKSAGYSHGSKAGGAEQSYPATAQWPAGRNAVLRGPQGQSTSYTFKPSPFQQKVNEKNADCAQDVKMVQKGPAAYQAKLQEKNNSLRIISVVIESMKHWSQYTNKVPLLFEVLGVLDSAVTPGQYGAKTFLLRDGKESVSCVFYEIDRELPRLIRGRVHRCMGNYDTKRKVFKCVSVRPATVPEQQTFQNFVKIADAEMSKFVKTSNEV
ncbi:spermatogenesis-associated protein 22 isoform X1 [Lacerta agilis]|uniref:spermatogenesis-associated protein 22 isoform X1 n=1 Tax=Lacerta agilis TaxID=80427 RepID=UPI0014193286|nr:spermatogenesis-associated protein 22 isoform X1 [Lacerta agilis]